MRRHALQSLCSIAFVPLVLLVLMCACNRPKEQTEEEESLGSTEEKTPILSLADFVLEYVLNHATEESYKNPAFLLNLKSLREFDKTFYGTLYQTQLADKYYLTRPGFSCCPCPPRDCCICKSSTKLGVSTTMKVSLVIKDSSGLDTILPPVDDSGASIYSFSNVEAGNHTLTITINSFDPPLTITTSITLEGNTIVFN